MSYKIILSSGDFWVEAELNDSKTAKKIYDVLPLTMPGTVWGGEVYFSIPVLSGLENSVKSVLAGDIAFWPPGSAFCIFFGPTPGSVGNEIRPASAVTPVGKIIGDPKIWMSVKEGDPVTIEKSQK